MKDKSKKRKSRYPVVRFLKYRVLHIDDSPHRIALGLAIGLFIAFLPVFGLRLPMIVLLALLLRANKFAAITSVCICNNIFTLPFISYSSYLVGWIICNSFHSAEALRPGQVGGMFRELFSFSSILSAFYQSRFWIELLELFKVIGLELVVGGAILGVIVALAAYFGCLHFIKWHRKSNPHKRFEKHQ